MTEVYHSGTPQRFPGDPHGSGRYREGSGEHPFQHSSGFLSEVEELKAQGLSEKEIAEAMGMSTTELRQRKAIAKEEKRAADAYRAYRMREHGYSNVEIGKRMGVPESSVRNLLKYYDDEKAQIISNTSSMLKENVDSKGYIDIGAGVELEVGISREKLKTSVKKLEDEGYVVHNVQVDQLGVTGNKTTVAVLCPPGTKYSDVVKNMENIHTINNYTTDNGKSYLGLERPKSISSDRVQIRYAEDGGAEKDGVIELRRGVDDISLGQSQYAQVRIGVDDTHYIKGMAMYSDNLPTGVDIVFNTNKTKDVPMIGENKSVLKEMKTDSNGNIDWDNPFGSYIKPKGQLHYEDENGNDILGCINIVNEEGDWGEWRKTIASQVLSKQSPDLAKKQLDISYNRAKAEYDEIMSLTNPTLKQKLLEKYADKCDSASVHLKAAALPRQASQVILPITSMKDNEVYAPNFRNGEQVALIRYPHAGTFEIPVLTVNNNQKEAKSTLGQAKDAIGINSNVAKRLSGADFDGDTVLVIPTNDRIKIKSTSPLKDLENFDPQAAYPAYEGMPKIKSQTKQNEMGRVSNLITDMTLKGATPDELVRAVKHSMVVIDSEKHNLNYKQSEKDNRIKELKEKYQTGGASTLISRAGSEIRVPERKAYVKTDPETGEKIFQETGRSYINKNGKLVKATTTTTRMAETKDARSLSSGTRMENLYSDYANSMKSLSNQARKEAYFTKGTVYSKTAAQTYSNEVKSLDEKLKTAKLNAPRERQAQIIANYIVKVKKQDNPELSKDKDRLKKVKAQALNNARDRVGAGKQKIEITDREWEAIQSGAITKSKFSEILDNSDLDSVKQRALPKPTRGLSSSKIQLAKSLAKAGYTQAEIADELGVSTSTVSKAINS